MEILNLSLPASNKFVMDYLLENREIQSFFHYGYKDLSEYKRRALELRNRSFFRQELASYIESFMKKYPYSEEIDKSLEKLKMDESVVVIGGQQAGIITGPLYTIHKIISIIVFAKQKEKELGIPVIPLFWIAGEDHDFQEINHIYVLDDSQPKKRAYPARMVEKKMASDVQIDKPLCLEWINDIIKSFGETDHTKELVNFIEDAVNSSETFVDFFANLVMQLFKEYGLLIVDSGDKDFRRLQKTILNKEIQDFKTITDSVLSQQAQLKSLGYPQTIEISADAANLFYYDDKKKERILLQFDDHSDSFIGKNGEIRFSKQQLLILASEFPETLSNNVVTRPLTQEWLFPSLAFIAGPGEISYWAELKKVFEAFEMKMPPIVPRLNITLLERAIESDITELGMDLKEVLSVGTKHHELKYINSVRDPELDELFSNLKSHLRSQYRLAEDKTRSLNKGLVPLLKKNEAILLEQLEFMELKIDQSICSQHDVILRRFGRIENSLRPNGSPQERVWNPLYYMNLYGLDLVERLTDLPFIFDGTHKVVKL